MHALELKIPPVAVVLVFAVLMWLAAIMAPSLSVAIAWRSAIAVALVGFGLGLAIAGVLSFRKARTTVNPLTPQATLAVVSSGVYRHSRNPMYVGMLFVLAGWAIVLSHAIPLVFLPIFIAYMNRFQIGPEERSLAAHFGAEYAAYLQSVRRWL